MQHRLESTIENTRRAPQDWVPAVLDTLLPHGSAAQLADELTTMLADLHPAGTRVAVAALAGADLRAALPGIEAPTLLIYGELDVRSPREVWGPIRNAIPRAEMVLVPDVGHMVDLQAAERTNAEIRSFVARVEGGRTG